MGFKPNGQPTKRRTLLNLRRPFLNHNGVNTLNFSPETGKLVLTTGDGGSGYDPFNLSQNNIEICGKIIEIDVTKNTSVNNPPVVTRFDELPISIQETLTVMAKGVRNIPGISFQRFHNQYIKYVGNVGQDLVESIFSFVNYIPIPVTQLVQSYLKSQPEKEKFINEVENTWKNSEISNEDIEIAKKNTIGSLVALSDDIFSINEKIVQGIVKYGKVLYNSYDLISGLNMNELNSIFKNIKLTNKTICLISPKNT